MWCQIEFRTPHEAKYSTLNDLDPAFLMWGPLTFLGVFVCLFRFCFVDGVGVGGKCLVLLVGAWVHPGS